MKSGLRPPTEPATNPVYSAASSAPYPVYATGLPGQAGGFVSMTVTPSSGAKTLIGLLCYAIERHKTLCLQGGRSCPFEAMLETAALCQEQTSQRVQNCHQRFGEGGRTDPEPMTRKTPTNLQARWRDKPSCDGEWEKFTGKTLGL